METVELIKAVGLAVTVVIIAIVGRRMQVVQPSPDEKPHRAAEQSGPEHDESRGGLSTTRTSFAQATGGVANQTSASRSRKKPGRRRGGSLRTA
jgi:hypothetical protein